MISRCAQFEFKAEKQWLCCCLWDHDDLFKCFLDFVSCNIDHFGCLWNCHLHLQYESKWCVIKTKNSNIFEHKSSSGIEADSVLDALLHGRGLAVRLWLETLQKLPSTQLCRWQFHKKHVPPSSPPLSPNYTHQVQWRRRGTPRILTQFCFTLSSQAGWLAAASFN